MTLTLADVIARTGKDVVDHLDRLSAIPTISRQACQGDVSILRVDAPAATTPMPPETVVAESVASPNTHTLHPHGPCRFDRHTPADPGDVVLGILTVPDGAEAYLAHPEHGALIIASGTYRIGRQRELRAECVAVRD